MGKCILTIVESIDHLCHHPELGGVYQSNHAKRRLNIKHTGSLFSGFTVYYNYFEEDDLVVITQVLAYEERSRQNK